MSTKRNRIGHEVKNSSSTVGGSSKVMPNIIQFIDERVENEFASTYYGLTALYKWLEIKHIQSPIFLPRTLKYRRKHHKKTIVPVESDKSSDKAHCAPEINFGKWKLEISAASLPYLREKYKQISIRFLIFVKLDDTGCELDVPKVKGCVLLAVSTFPVPSINNFALPSNLIGKAAKLGSSLILVTQLIEGDKSIMIPQLKLPHIEADGKAIDTVKILDITSYDVDQQQVLSAGEITLSLSRHRCTYCSIELSPVAEDFASKIAKVRFEIIWDRMDPKHKQRHLTKTLRKIPKTEEYMNDAAYTLKARKTIPISKSPGENDSVWFYYLFDRNLRRKCEHRINFACPWCNMHCGNLRGLLAHLICSHDRLQFMLEIGPDVSAHIHVKRNDKYSSEADSESAAGKTFSASSTDHLFHYFVSDKYPRYVAAKTLPDSALDIQMSIVSEFEDLKKESDNNLNPQLTERQYFHSRTGAVVLDHEKDYDSDDDVDESWIITQSEKLLDEFEDVSLEEKEFMKRWNRHLKKYRILADFMVASACRLFAKENALWLVENGLRYPFLLHLFNLWDNSLLHGRAILECMMIMDDVAEKEKSGVDVDMEVEENVVCEPSKVP